MVSIAEAADQLGVSIYTVRRRIKDGALVGELVNGKYQVDLTAEATETPPEGHTAAWQEVNDLLRVQVAELQRQLEVREREIGQLHTEIMQLHQLLGQKQLESTISRPWWRIWSR